MPKIYALYKGEKLLATGTMIQISHKMGIKLETLRYYKTQSWFKKRKGKLDKCRILVEINQEQD